MNTYLLLMAAGFGTRFSGGIKQIVPVGPNGEVLMDYAVHDALRAGFDRVVFIIRKDIEAEFRAGVGRRVEKKCDVEYVYQDVADIPPGFEKARGRVNPWGTGQAVLACRNVVRGPFCVLNSDDYYGAEAFRQIHSYITSPKPKTDGMDLCMAGYVLGNTLSESGAVTRGICRVGEDGRLLNITETRGVTREKGEIFVPDGCGRRTLDASSTVSMNIWGMPPEFIDYLQEGFAGFLANLGDDALTAEYLLPTIVGGMIASGRGSVQVLPTGDRWFGMTYAQDKIQTQREIAGLIARGLYPAKM